MNVIQCTVSEELKDVGYTGHSKTKIKFVKTAFVQSPLPSPISKSKPFGSFGYAYEKTVPPHQAFTFMRFIQTSLTTPTSQFNSDLFKDSK
jgi:hypothetical protein